MFTIKKYRNTKLRQSTFGHFFVKGRTACAYNALKIKTIYFPAEILPFIKRTCLETINSVIKDIPEKLEERFNKYFTEICQAHILIPPEYDELTYLKKIKPYIFLPPSPRVAVLHVTDYCNLRCRYCFIEGNIGKDYKRQDMSFEVMEKSIDKFWQIIKGKKFPQKPSIVFYGGEPLCNWTTIKHGLEYLAQQQSMNKIGKGIDKVIISNGTLITESIAQELKKHQVQAAISIDGFQEVHNANRIFKNGKGSFDRAIHGFMLLREHGLKPTVASVLSKSSLPYVEEIADWLLNDMEVKALGFNHVSIVPGVNEYDPNYENQTAEALLLIQEIIQSKHPDVYERRMNRKFNCFLNQEILRADCTGCGEQMSISPDGKIGICQGYMGNRKTFNNTVFNNAFIPENDAVFKEWSQRSPLNMEQCYSCAALSTCGGGCPRNADYIHGSIWEIDSAFCHFAKKAQEWMIWKKFQALQT